MRITDTDSKVTIDLAAIKNWTTDRSGLPAVHKNGELTIYFETEHPAVKPSVISWNEFSRQFQNQALAFIYQETTSSGAISRDFKLVER